MVANVGLLCCLSIDEIAPADIPALLANSRKGNPAFFLRRLMCLPNCVVSKYELQEQIHQKTEQLLKYTGKNVNLQDVIGMGNIGDKRMVKEQRSALRLNGV
ncbi:MAG: hypothetical protein A2Y07_08130 [Planctomycetes bacterium GWF2_50_10]|nr:MAG: hypothetical protein A2Y07_08130 [Planctomycetes bacterium GWF2_50_10]